MAKSSGKKLTYFIVIFLSFLLTDCANQLPPGGGEVDKIPPKIIEVFPANETINFNEDYFELGFSEYVDKRTVRDAIFISPALEGNIELSWSGKYVRVYFPEELRENTTYVITIGTDVVDFNASNRMAEAFNFTFSTGNKIDRKMITGKVFDEKPEGVLLFAYKLQSDTLNPMEDKPDYISQTGNSGEYKLLGLGEGLYRVYAVEDEFRDLIFQPDQDRYGSPSRDIFLNKEDTLVSNLNFFLSKIDTVKPRLLSASMTDQNHILVNLSEAFDSTIIRSDNFFIYDSTKNERKDVRFSYKGNTKETEMVLVVRDNFNEGDEIFLFADTIRDKAGNFYPDDFTPVTISTAPDTTKPHLFKTLPAAESKTIDFQNQTFSFFFNDAFDTSDIVKGISFTDTLGRFVPFSITFYDDASFQAKSSLRLEKQKDYIIKINLNNLKDLAGNFHDSLYQYNFKTISGLDFTGASGILQNTDYEKNPIIILQQIDADKTKYVQKPLRNGKFNFERVYPGKYMLWSFYDENANGEYDYGYPFPYKPAEQFSFYPDTLELRARWTETDINYEFK